MWTKTEKVEYLYTASESKNRHIHFQKIFWNNKFESTYILKTRVFQPWHFWHFEPDNSLVWGGCPVYYRMSSIIHGLYLLDTSSTHSSTINLLWKPVLSPANVKCPLGREKNHSHWESLTEALQFLPVIQSFSRVFCLNSQEPLFCYMVVYKQRKKKKTTINSWLFS